MHINQENNLFLAEDKLFLLYIIEQFREPITNLQVVKLILNFREINYFSLQQLLTQLVEKKLLICYLVNDERTYEITDQGRQMLTFFKDRLTVSGLEKLDKYLNQNISPVKNENQVICDYTPESEDKFYVNCKLTEGKTTLVEVKLFAGSRQEAISICNNWSHNINDIYPKIIELMTKKGD